MVMIREEAQKRIYRVWNTAGYLIGRIVEPRSATVLGPNAGTVLLARDLPRRRPLTPSPSDPLGTKP